MKLLLSFSVFLIATSFSSALSSQQSFGSASTIAGDGYAGFNDGSSTTARFMAPAGVAYDAEDQDLYISDYGAQRIRKIDHFGNVSTIAGSGQVSKNGLDVIGGYADGPAKTARFNRPTGIAIGPDHSIYVSDSFNHCVRKISHGLVSTVAGRPGDNSGADGTLEIASFIEPRGIAVSLDGTIYVADKGKGIRLISGSEVKTFSVTMPIDVESVALYEKDHNKVIFFATPGYIGRYDFVAVKSQIIKGSSAFAGLYAFTDVLPISKESVLVAGAGYHTIYDASFDCLNDFKCLKIITGGDDEDSTQSGGFRDGPFADALFYNPIGLARIDKTTFAVADSSNRRVRKLLFRDIVGDGL